LLSDKRPRPVGAPRTGLAGTSAGAARASQRWIHAAIAASLIGVAISGAWYARHIGVLAPVQKPSTTVQAAVQSSILPDGSTLTLAPRTDITVDFDGAQRSLALVHGDAYFDVRPDKSKPFVVQTAGLRITAIGTAFDVRSRADRVLVTVQEGVVEVARVNAAGIAGDDGWRVSAGKQIAYEINSGAARIAEVDSERALSWREGRLEYFSEPLGSVVTDVSRYSARPIEVGDPQLAALRFTGTVFTGSIDDWLGAVEATFPVRVVVTRDDRVLLLRRSTGEGPDASK
jgi:transmembrane sensor